MRGGEGGRDVTGECAATQHGTWIAYRRHGCRCPEMVERARAAWRRQWHTRGPADPELVDLAIRGWPVAMSKADRYAAIERALAAGMSARAAADLLRVSPRTVQRRKAAVDASRT
jgi:DNA-binding NarL/FixJ family response regulator